MPYYQYKNLESIFAVSGLHDIDEYIQAQLLLAVSIATIMWAAT